MPVVTNVQSATHGATALPGLKRFSFNTNTSIKRSQSDGNPEVLDAVSASSSGQAVFDDVSTYNTAVEAAEQNLVVVGRVVGGAATREFTAKNVKFTGASGNLPDLVGQQMGEFVANWIGSPGASDTAATMVTNAAGA